MHTASLIPAEPAAAKRGAVVEQRALTGAKLPLQRASRKFRLPVCWAGATVLAAVVSWRVGVVVPQRKPSSWAWPRLPWASSFWAVLLCCYSPEIGEEFSVIGAGGQLGTNVWIDTLPPASVSPLQPVGSAGAAAAAGLSGRRLDWAKPAAGCYRA